MVFSFVVPFFVTAGEAEVDVAAVDVDDVDATGIGPEVNVCNLANRLR